MKNVESALKTLRDGGLIIVPTDTVYGALVDATNKKAVEKLIQFKERPAGKPISIFVADFEMLKEYVEVSERQLNTLKNILPGPFTAILKSKKKVISLLESEYGTLGVRMVQYPFIVELVKKFGKPITATSANISGQGSNYDVLSLLSKLSQKKKNVIDSVVNAGKLPQNMPSTVIDLTQPEIKIIRQGDLKIPISKSQFPIKSQISNSEEETKQIAKKILTDVIARSEATKQSHKPLIFILEGDLGVGKTIFVKGIGEFLGIKNIISPTFVIYYEYLIHNSKFIIQNSKFIHVDLYNLEKEEEFEHLRIEKYLKPGNILCIEWGEKAGKIIDTLKQKGTIVFVKMRYLNKVKREITVSQ